VNASLEKSERYKYPIYGKPSDLVELNLRDFGAELPDARLVGHVKNGKFVPYYKRADIENDGINAPVLMWADDPVDIHFMQIQGSAIAKMDDGSELRIGYADNNGHKFRGIGSIMLEKKLLKPGEVSMENIRKWLRKHPEEAKKLMQQNERFIFQRLSDADGPLGAFGVPLTAGRSMAIDNSLLPLGALFWLDTVSPDKEPLQKLVFAQDIGAAIKGAVRGDYFWGHGDEALYYAGRMNSAGKYYILLPKNTTLKVE
jgi:membrane-bound lytic murein transglycosylase A